MPKMVDHDQRRAEIVTSARSLISESGVEAMTLRNLAHRCGLANGALRRYFPFKRDVLLALDEDVRRRTDDYLAREGYPDQRGRTALRTLLDAMLPLDEERTVSAEVHATLRDQALSDEAFAEAFRHRVDQFFQRLVKHLREADEDGELTGGRSIEVTAALLVNTVAGISVTSLVGNDRGLSRYDAAVIDAVIDAA